MYYGVYYVVCRCFSLELDSSSYGFMRTRAVVVVVVGGRKERKRSQSKVVMVVIWREEIDACGVDCCAICRYARRRQRSTPISPSQKLQAQPPSYSLSWYITRLMSPVALRRNECQ